MFFFEYSPLLGEGQHFSNPRPEEGDVGRSELHSHPLLCDSFDTYLDCWKLSPNKPTQNSKQKNKKRTKNYRTFHLQVKYVQLIYYRVNHLLRLRFSRRNGPLANSSNK